MLRKTVHIIITALLLTATTGFTVSRHYCGNTLVSFSLSAEAAACCEDISGECCHDVSEHFEIDQEFVTSSLSLENVFFFTYESIQSVTNFQNPESNSGISTVPEKLFPLKTHLLLVRLQKLLL